MGTLKNSVIHDWNGGFQKEYTSDNGQKYIIRNSVIHDWNGGFQKEVVPCDTSRRYYLTPKQNRRIWIVFTISMIVFWSAILIPIILTAVNLH